MKILLSDSFDASLPKKLEEFGEVTNDKSQQSTANVVLIRSKTTCDREYIDQAPELQLIIRGGVGLDNVDVEYAKSKGIQVFNTAEASAVAVAELAFALMIAVPTRIVEGHMGMKEGKWLKKELGRTELLGKTLGMIGVGNIGTEVAKRAKAFGMTVIANDPQKATHEHAEMVSFEELLTRSDYISINAPLTDTTRNIIRTETIARMKDGVILVNTARGKIVNEVDLTAALESGKVRSYATDVWYSDPPASDSPLLTAPNVVMTPHIGASSDENMLRIGDVVVRIIRDFVSHSA